MQNLEQIRARNALHSSEEKNFLGKEGGGSLIKKIPPIIMNNGFLAAAAYGFDEKNKGWGDAFDAIAEHLSDPSIGILPANCNNLKEMVRHLIDKNSTSETLKLATAEAMAWLNFARRFVKPETEREY